jgi:hypothetical protein
MRGKATRATTGPSSDDAGQERTVWELSQNGNKEVCRNLADELGVAVLRTLMRKAKALVSFKPLSGKWMCLTFVSKKEQREE